MALMKAGIPIGKLDCVEENGYRLTDSRHLLDLVAFISKQEKDLLRSEVKGKKLSMVFDGTSRLGEVLAVVIRFVDASDDWEVQQRLIRLEFLQKSVNGEEHFVKGSYNLEGDGILILTCYQEILRI